MKKYLLAGIILVMFCGMAFAETQYYEGVKGDFKIFCLGDSPEVVKDKTKYLIKRKELTYLWVFTAGERFTYSFDYYNNQLYKIRLKSSGGYTY